MGRDNHVTAREHEPMSRLTRLSGFMLDALELHPEFDSDHDRVVVLTMTDADEHDNGGIGITGYQLDVDGEDSDRDLLFIEDLLLHLRAFIESTDLPLQVALIRKDN